MSAVFTVLQLHTVFLNAVMPDCPASGHQSGTQIENADARNSPAPEKGHSLRCRNADAGGIDVGADAKLC